MNKTKEIEEMAKYFCGRRNRICKLCCSFTGGVCVENCKFLQFSKDLHNAGYGNIKQAVKEFAELLDNKAQDLNGDSWDEYNEGFKRGVEETLFLMYDLITELYGADERNTRVKRRGGEDGCHIKRNVIEIFLFPP